MPKVKPVDLVGFLIDDDHVVRKNFIRTVFKSTKASSLDSILTPEEKTIILEIKTRHAEFLLEIYEKEEDAGKFTLWVVNDWEAAVALAHAKYHVFDFAFVDRSGKHMDGDKAVTALAALGIQNHYNTTDSPVRIPFELREKKLYVSGPQKLLTLRDCSNQIQFFRELKNKSLSVQSGSSPMTVLTEAEELRKLAEAAAGSGVEAEVDVAADQEVLGDGEGPEGRTLMVIPLEINTPGDIVLSRSGSLGSTGRSSPALIGDQLNVDAKEVKKVSPLLRQARHFDYSSTANPGESKSPDGMALRVAEDELPRSGAPTSVSLRGSVEFPHSLMSTPGIWTRASSPLTQAVEIPRGESKEEVIQTQAPTTCCLFRWLRSCTKKPVYPSSTPPPLK